MRGLEGGKKKILKFVSHGDDLAAARRGRGGVDSVGTYQREDVLVGSSREHPRQVAEVQAPAQQAPPVRVAVVVVVDDAGEAQRHVAEKRCVLHHVGVSCGVDRFVAAQTKKGEQKEGGEKKKKKSAFW